MSDLNKNDYYDLDGGGIIYPYLANGHWNHQFRTEVELDAPVDVPRIRRALEIIRPRFPSFFVVLAKHKGAYVLKKTDKLPEVVPEVGLCRTFDLKSEEHSLFRITYAGNRLGMEIFHSLSDGAGANVLFINDNCAVQVLLPKGGFGLDGDLITDTGQKQPMPFELMIFNGIPKVKIGEQYYEVVLGSKEDLAALKQKIAEASKPAPEEQLTIE